MRRLAEGLERLLTGISAVILMVLLAVVLMAVALRYFFATGLTGSEELAIWLYVGLISAGAPLTRCCGLRVLARREPQRCPCFKRRPPASR